jgi:hypothetical protein
LPITNIHTYLVHPAKGSEDAASVGGAAIALSGKMFDLLKGIYDRCETECDISISFNRAANGTQQNDCRDLMLTYLGGPTVVRGRYIASRLAKVTTNRSHLGLLFLIAGQEGLDHKLVVSRFPADSGILAEEDANGLSVEFLEKVFMKNAKSYKAVMYRHRSLSSGFWEGKATDKQVNSSEIDIPNYWIAEFLESDFRTTAAAGTRRLAIACRDAARKSDNSLIKSEIAAAATLATGLSGQRFSVRQFANRIGLTPAAQAAIFAELKPAVVDEAFQLDASEFSRIIAYRSIELDNGGMLTAEVGSFDDVFQRQPVDGPDSQVRFSTEGKIVSEKLGKARQ